jgi:hypothetical protein
MKNLTKYLGPYVNYYERGLYPMVGRKSLIGNGIYLICMNDLNNWFTFSFVETGHNSFETKESAMKYLDEKLIENGYMLCSVEEFEKLKVLV